MWTDTDLGVWHLNEDECDATINTNHGVNHNSTNATGIAAGGHGFNGSSSYVDLPATLKGMGVSDAFSIGFWFRTPTKAGGMLMEDGTSAANDAIYLGVTSANQMYARLNTDKGGVVNDYIAVGIVGTNWHAVNFVYDGTDVRLYVDAVQKWSPKVMGIVKEGSRHLRLGHRPDNASYFLNGLMDEVRIESVSRSANWIWASFFNMASNNLFMVYGESEFQDFPVVKENDWATHVTASSAWLSGTLSSTGFYDTAVFAYWGPTDGGTNASAWANTNTWTAPQISGTFTIQANELLANSAYCYRFAASNAAGWAWAPETSFFITGNVWIEKTVDALEIGPTPGTFTVHRADTATNEALIVNYAVGGTALSGADYTVLSGTVMIPKGGQTAVIEVLPIFDYVTESPETVVVTVVPGPYVIGTPSSATMEIVDYGAPANENLLLWQKRMPIAFSGYTPPGGGEALTNFPVLVILSNTIAGSGFAYSDFQSPPYSDLRFAATDKKTPLDFEVVSWNTNGLSYVWVRVPELTHNAKIYAVWGQSGIGVPPPCTTNGAVWSEGFTGVWHLEETNGVIAHDAIGNRYPGRMIGDNASMGATGRVGHAYRFGGNTGYVETHLTNGTTVTISAWGSLTSVGTCMLWSRATYYPDLMFASGNIFLNAADSQNNPFCAQPADVEQLHHYVTVIDAERSKASLYIDGQFASDNADYKNPEGTPFKISSGCGSDWHGVIDEFTVAGVARSSNWIWASFVNMASNDLFTVYGDPAFQALPEVEESGWATNVTTSSTWLNGTLSSTGTSATAVFAYWGPADGGTNTSAWTHTGTWAAPQTPGVFTIQATNLSVNSTYHYRFAASNATGWVWASEAAIFITGEVWTENTADAAEFGTAPGTFTVHRVGAVTNASLTITYTVGGTATSGADYTALSGTVTIPKGEDSAVIEVAPVFDYFLEGPETVVLALVPGPYAIGIASNATVVIADYGAPADENLLLWQKRMSLTFSGYVPSGDSEALTNFPVLVILSNTAAGVGFAYSEFQSPPYDDLRFAAADKKTPLDFEVASWDTNGLSYVWVRVPELTHNTSIYAVWGRDDIGAPPPYTTDGAVWSEGFTGVWHLEETKGFTVRDAIGNRYPGRIFGDKISMSATGRVGRAYRFSGGTGYVATDLTNGPTVTVSAWGSLTSVGTCMLWNRSTYRPDLQFASSNIYLNAGDGLNNPFCAQPVDVAQLHHYVTVIEDSPPLASLYIDGQLAGLANYKDPSGTSFKISSGAFYDWHGIIDEFTVADVARSSNWVWASFFTMASNDLFVVYGIPEFQNFPASRGVLIILK